MHWVDVEDLQLPVLVGGHPALDFCNTWAGWGDPPAPEREWLPTYDHLAAWAGYAGLLPSEDVSRLRRAARRNDTEARSVLVAARSLRDSIHAAALDSGDRRALQRVTAAAQEAATASRLRPRPEGGAEWVFGQRTGLDLPRLAAARSAAELLTSNASSAVRACPGDDCGWLFVDRRGRRRWCSMSACGNRAKARRHAERQRRR